jgi:hypothetical protein
VPVE